jgi:hypothetical protein
MAVSNGRQFISLASKALLPLCPVVHHSLPHQICVRGFFWHCFVNRNRHNISSSFFAAGFFYA